MCSCLLTIRRGNINIYLRTIKLEGRGEWEKWERGGKVGSGKENWMEAIGKWEGILNVPNMTELSNQWTLFCLLDVEITVE